MNLLIIIHVNFSHISGTSSHRTKTIFISLWMFYDISTDLPTVPKAINYVSSSCSFISFYLLWFSTLFQVVFVRVCLQKSQGSSDRRRLLTRWGIPVQLMFPRLSGGILGQWCKVLSAPCPSQHCGQRNTFCTWRTGRLFLWTQAGVRRTVRFHRYCCGCSTHEWGQILNKSFTLNVFEDAINSKSWLFLFLIKGSRVVFIFNKKGRQRGMVVQGNEELSLQHFCNAEC